MYEDFVIVEPMDDAGRPVPPETHCRSTARHRPVLRGHPYPHPGRVGAGAGMWVPPGAGWVCASSQKWQACVVRRVTVRGTMPAPSRGSGCAVAESEFTMNPWLWVASWRPVKAASRFHVGREPTTMVARADGCRRPRPPAPPGRRPPAPPVKTPVQPRRPGSPVGDGARRGGAAASAGGR